jgi:hypothetical protein
VEEVRNDVIERIARRTAELRAGATMPRAASR